MVSSEKVVEGELAQLRADSQLNQSVLYEKSSAALLSDYWTTDRYHHKTFSCNYCSKGHSVVRTGLLQWGI